jgi:hypothetical protein
MTLRIINANLGAALILALHITCADARFASSLQVKSTKSSPVVSQATYNRVLDILFPREDSEPSKAVFAFVLRFKPSFQSESQIVVKRGTDNAEAIEYTSLDGNIYGKLNEVLARTGKEDAAEMARLIRVRKRAVEVSHSQVEQWHMRFLASVSGSLKAFRQASEEYNKAGSVTVALDGTFYDLWYEQGLNKLSFGLYDEEVNDLRSTGDLKLAQWMNVMRIEIKKLK